MRRIIEHAGTSRLECSHVRSIHSRTRGNYRADGNVNHSGNRSVNDDLRGHDVGRQPVRCRCRKHRSRDL